MDAEPVMQTEDIAVIEQRKLEAVYNELPQEAQEAIGPLQIEPVGNAGFIIQRGNNIPMAGNDWILYDYDDTIAATTGAKGPRLEAFTEYAKGRIQTLDDETCKSLMGITDRFSRWEEQSGAGKNYHPHMHILALDWATNEAQRMFNDGSTSEVVLEHIQTTLARISRGEALPDDPFHFSDSTRKLISNGIRTRNTEIEEIFATTLGDPTLYEDILESIRRQSTPLDSVNRTNVGILTYGEPHFQLRKLLRMLQADPNLPISQILLTKIPKGEFIKAVIEEHVEQRFPVDYVPSHLDDDGSFGSLGSGGQLLSESQHTVVVFDDDPDQLDSIYDASREVKDRTGAHIVTIRSIRSGTKAESKVSKTMRSEYGEIDFRNKKGQDFRVEDVLLVSRFLAVKQGIENGDIDPHYPHFTFLKDELLRRKIEIED